MALIECGHLASMEEILNTLLVKNPATGQFGFRTVTTVVGVGELTDSVACGQPLKTVEDVLRHSITLDGDGKPAIQLYEVD